MGEIRVLVVEDSIVHQRLLAEAFKAAGQSAVLELHGDAISAWDALERMRAQPLSEWPDFAIVDVGLPGMDGIELVDRIRQQRQFDGWPIVVLTASRDPEDRSESILANATGFFVKPATAAGYADLVRDILLFLGHHPRAPARRTAPRPSSHTGA